ncbi:MAG: Fic family protein [Gammaproteobacteria bacterium]|nr:Fic family protein [Gammaproteobacteria bacterium]MDH5650707.1 Fic family protein [Gammaproteobacteria bacterium]
MKTAVKENLGFTWSESEIMLAPHEHGATGACFEVKKMLAEYVWDITWLEDNPCTFAEVQTVTGGTTIGSHTLEDLNQIINQKNAILKLVQMVKDKEFSLTRAVHQQLHAQVAKEEALEWGKFRTGAVKISGTPHQPPAASELDDIYETGFAEIRKIDNVVERALVTYLFSALNQFFFDGNKRTGRLMMNGVLMSNGYSYISIPGAKKEEFDQKMLNFYNTKDATEMMGFIVDCANLWD